MQQAESKENLQKGIKVRCGVLTGITAFQTVGCVLLAAAHNLETWSVMTSGLLTAGIAVATAYIGAKNGQSKGTPGKKAFAVTILRGSAIGGLTGLQAVLITAMAMPVLSPLGLATTMLLWAGLTAATGRLGVGIGVRKKKLEALPG